MKSSKKCEFCGVSVKKTKNGHSFEQHSKELYRRLEVDLLDLSHRIEEALHSNFILQEELQPFTVGKERAFLDLMYRDTSRLRTAVMAIIKQNE